MLSLRYVHFGKIAQGISDIVKIFSKKVFLNLTVVNQKSEWQLSRGWQLSSKFVLTCPKRPNHKQKCLKQGKNLATKAKTILLLI